MTARIFISYRRADTQGWAGRLCDALTQAFGTKPLFFDLESIMPGDDFVDAIENAVRSASVLLALIGPHWLTTLLPDGHRRLDDPNDLVRLEIVAALSRDVRVIPVLLGGVAMPQQSELPPEIMGLARRQAFELTDKRWEYDFDQLARAIEETAGLTRTTSSSDSSIPDRNAISVGAGATLGDFEAQDVVGIKGEGGVARAAHDRPINVLSGAKVERGKLRDIAGIIERDRKDEKP